MLSVSLWLTAVKQNPWMENLVNNHSFLPKAQLLVKIYGKVSSICLKQLQTDFPRA